MISVYLPSIRTHLLEGFYSSLEAACSYPFEVVVCGPFEPPQSLLDKSNFVFIQDYGSPTRCAQRAANACKYPIIYHTTDDCVFLPEAINRSIDFFLNNATAIDMLGMPYREGRGHSGRTNGLDYWSISNSDYRNWASINKEWKINCHFLIYKSKFVSVGGFDCVFDYLNHACHDLQFRLQQQGSKFYVGTEDVTSADWNPGTAEHRPIADAQIKHDTPIFEALWFNGNPERYIIDFDNWQLVDPVWKTRFGDSTPKSYKELYN